MYIKNKCPTREEAAQLAQLLGDAKDFLRIGPYDVAEEDVIAKRVRISGGTIKGMVLAGVVEISGPVKVDGGRVICGKLYHVFSHEVRNGGEIFSGEEFAKPGERCANYVPVGIQCSNLQILTGG